MGAGGKTIVLGVDLRDLDDQGGMSPANEALGVLATSAVRVATDPVQLVCLRWVLEGIVNEIASGAVPVPQTGFAKAETLLRDLLVFLAEIRTELEAD